MAPLLPLLLGLLHLLGAIAAAPDAGGEISYARVFSFGDSLADTGNSILFAPGGGQSSMPPYGETYFHHPTGRYSDGRLVIDFIVEALKIPHITPFLAGKTVQDFQYGANFAVGGATALDPEFFEKKGLPVFVPYCLNTEMSWFKKVLQVLGSSDQEQRKIMASSLFLVGEIGCNDYFISLFRNRTLHEVKTYVPSIIETISSSVSDLIELGAKTVVVPGMIPLGCLPQMLAFFQSDNPDDYDPKSGCIVRFNELAEHHNCALKHTLDRLRGIHRNATVIYADYYNVITRITTSSLQYGFGETPLDACCGGVGPYNMNSTVRCGSKGSTVCADPSKYVSWDGIHFTEATYRVVAGGILDGPYANPPILSKHKRRPEKFDGSKDQCA